MGEFFRGWKRKNGCLALVLACVSMSLLMRGETYHDTLSIPCGANTKAELSSVHGYLLFDSEATEEKAFWNSLTWRSLFCCDRSMYLFYLDKSVGWRFQCFAIGIYKQEGHYKLNRRIAFVRRTVFVSYWSIVVPLTLISAWLLLSKPRPHDSQSPRQPHPETAE